MEATRTTPAEPSSPTRRGEAGFTLIELVMTLSLASIVALVPASILHESMRVYARLAPSIDASYQARFANARLRNDLRALEQDAKIGLTGNTLTLASASGATTVYLLVDGRLTRNGDLLARGVKALSYRLRGRDGGTLPSGSADIALVECDLSLTLDEGVHRTIISVCPGFARHDATAGLAAAKSGLAMTRTPPREQGSVLVPVIVALVLLSLAGAALTELFAAQRLGSVDARESKRAYWTSEAGLWHASLDPASIKGPVAFAGSTYEVAAVGEQLQVRASSGGIVHELTSSVLSSLVDADGDHPLDAAASSESAYQHQDEHFHMALVSASQVDAVIQQFAIAATSSMPTVDSMRLGGFELLPGGVTFGLPAGPFDITHVGAAVRTVPAGGSLDLRLGFAAAPRAEHHDLTVYFGFTDGTFVALPVSVAW